QRQALPVNQYKSEIIRLINQNRVVLISGQTGSGKSTQIPQFILEDLILQGRDHETHIICTQPRRISAMSISSRVSEEMGDKRVGELVGYSIRLMSKVSSMTKLVFSTMGVLLRRLESDVTLEGVSHVIVDEVHERSMESDFLLCVLRKVMARRPDLKIVLMSATLEADRFSAYFDNCPILDIPGRTFPVDVKYLEDAVEMTSYMLEEDSEYSRRIQRSTYQQQLELEEDETATYPEDQAPLLSDYSKSTQKMLRRMDPFKINYDLIAHLLENICVMKEEYRRVNGAILIFLPGLMEIRRCLEIIRSFSAFRDTNDYWVLPLHSSLSISDQQKVFEIPPLGVRKIVLTTNIAETGVTIPDVVFVIDTGKAKQLEYDERRQVTSLQESFVSQANCKQRRGRAGRVQAGFCFHLFSRYRYDNQMSAYQKPEVLRLPLDQLCIKIKQYGFADLRQFFNALIDAPQALAVTNAITRLQIVQALDSNENLTPLGHHLGQLPVDVQLGKMLIFGSVFKCLDPIITIVACLNVKSPFVTPFGKETEADAAREKFMLGNSDLLTMYNAYNQWRDVYRQSPSNSRDFCYKNFLSYYNLTMIEETKKQFLDLLISAKFIRLSEDTSTRNNSSTLCPAPSEYNTHSSDLKVITATITAGLQPNILLLSNPSATKPILSAANGAVNIHPSSVHFRRFQNYDPLTAMSSYPSPWFTYYTKVKSSKTYVWDCTSTGSLPVFLFSRDIQVEYAKKTVILDKWVQIKCFGKTAVHLILLRKQLVRLTSADIYLALS
ncbi:P-loop containing nucleoside triphosphate hydrolase protein, partial [Paraphysoderma sedebokerense]